MNRGVNLIFFAIFVHLVVVPSIQQSITEDQSPIPDHSLSTPASNSVEQSNGESTLAYHQDIHNDIIETVYLPQNKIPLRLLQRNRWWPISTASPRTESSAAAPTGELRKPVENMIMRKMEQVQFRQSNGVEGIIRNRPSTSSPLLTTKASTLPLPVSLDKVPFHLRPQQEIQNRLIAALWQKEGKNLTQYFEKFMENLKNATANSTQARSAATSSTTVTTTTQEPTTEATTVSSTAVASIQSRSFLAEFMANKNENARDYLRAIFSNQLGGEQQHYSGDEAAKVQQDFQLFPPVQIIRAH